MDASPLHSKMARVTCASGQALSDTVGRALRREADALVELRLQLIEHGGLVLFAAEHDQAKAPGRTLICRVGEASLAEQPGQLPQQLGVHALQKLLLGRLQTLRCQF